MILAYIRRLAKQTINRIFFAVDVISVFLLLYPPLQISPFISLGLRIFIILTFLISGYSVFLEISNEHQKEIERLQSRINELEGKRPEIKVWFQADSGVTSELGIQLARTELKPDYDALLEQERKRLNSKRDSHQFSSISEAISKQLNPNYDEEVEEYIRQYRRYLERSYDVTLYEDRFRRIRLAAENAGSFTASDVTLELRLPKDLIPTDDQRRAFEMYKLYKDKPSPPEEPELYQDMFALGGMLSDIRLSLPAMGVPPASPHLDNRNVDGPHMELRGDELYIIYKIGKLVPHLIERDFPRLSLWLGGVDMDTTWDIPIRIYAADLTVPDTTVIKLTAKILAEQST